jgi:hypothetical protein
MSRQKEMCRLPLLFHSHFPSLLLAARLWVTRDGDFRKNLPIYGLLTSSFFRSFSWNDLLWRHSVLMALS